MAVFYLVRHAHADFVPDEHRGLSCSGASTASMLCAQLRYKDISAIYASPYLRAVQTIRPLARDLALPIHLHLGLRERRLAAQPVEDFAQAAKASWQAMDSALPGGESNTVAQARGVRVLQQLVGTERSVVISTHGTLLALMLNAFDAHYDHAFWQQLQLPDAFRLDVSLDTRGKLQIAHIERVM